MFFPIHNKSLHKQKWFNIINKSIYFIGIASKSVPWSIQVEPFFFSKFVLRWKERIWDVKICSFCFLLNLHNYDTQQLQFTLYVQMFHSVSGTFFSLMINLAWKMTRSCIVLWIMKMSFVLRESISLRLFVTVALHSWILGES